MNNILIKLVLCASACVCAMGAIAQAQGGTEGAPGRAAEQDGDEDVGRLFGGEVWVCGTRAGGGGGGAGWGCGAAGLGEGAGRRGRWVAARASCLARAPQPPAALRVLRRPAPRPCDLLHRGVDEPGARRVLSVHVHPGAAWAHEARSFDVVLLELDRPFDGPVHLVNHTMLHHNLRDLSLWMEAVSMYRHQEKPPNPHYLFSSPLLTVMSTVVLPAALFMGFFLFVTFCTGTPIKVPYANVDINEVPTQLVMHEYSLAVPKCGQV